MELGGVRTSPSSTEKQKVQKAQKPLFLFRVSEVFLMATFQQNISAGEPIDQHFPQNKRHTHSPGRGRGDRMGEPLPAAKPPQHLWLPSNGAERTEPRPGDGQDEKEEKLVWLEELTLEYCRRRLKRCTILTDQRTDGSAAGA